jgi:hypothetical protein
LSDFCSLLFVICKILPQSAEIIPLRKVKDPPWRGGKSCFGRIGVVLIFPAPLGAKYL